MRLLGSNTSAVSVNAISLPTSSGLLANRLLLVTSRHVKKLFVLTGILCRGGLPALLTPSVMNDETVAQANRL